MTEDLPGARLRAGDVLVDFGDRQWVVRAGDSLTIGRSEASIVRLPPDSYLSRRAGSLRVLDDCVLVRNESRVKPLVVRPPAGEDRVVEPGAATTSLPMQRFELVFAAGDARSVTIHVDASRLTPDPLVTDPSSVDPVTRTPATMAEPIRLSGAQRRVLTALCAPILHESGPRAVPATYAQIGRRLDRQPQYVRNVLKALRETLSGYGVADLTSEGGEAGHEDFRWALARWAIRGGWVTVADVAGADD